MIQRKKTATKKQAVRQAQILPFLISIKMLLLQPLQEHAAEFAPICSALRQTQHQKKRSSARLCNCRWNPERAKRERKERLLESYLHRRAWAPKLQRRSPAATWG